MTNLVLIVSTLLSLVMGPRSPGRAPAAAEPQSPAPRERTWRETDSRGVVRTCAAAPVFGYGGRVIGEVRRCF